MIKRNKKLMSELSLSLDFVFANGRDNSNKEDYGDLDFRSYDEIKKILNKKLDLA